MGVSYPEKYKTSPHFRARALERFGIDADQLDRWIKQILPTLIRFSPKSHRDFKRQLYRSPDGIIFVCNTVDYILVTCFEMSELMKDIQAQNVSLHARNHHQYKEERQKLKNRYKLKDCKEMLQLILPEIKAFAETAEKVSHARYSAHSIAKMEEMIEHYHNLKISMTYMKQKLEEY